MKKGATLDRETFSVYNLQITAIDGKNDSDSNRRQTSVLVEITVLDINDNAPKFLQEDYKAVVPENIPIGSSIGSIKAVDADEGDNSRVRYELIDLNDSQNVPYFAIDEQTGVINVTKPLSGRGRVDPYELHIRAFDHGIPPLYSETRYYVQIGDISKNDGIPRFIKPTVDEMVAIKENVKPGTFVYQVEAIDADSPSSPNGKIVYKFLEPNHHFDIDATSGIITTSLNPERSLDRERYQNFTVILVASDLGVPPQVSHRILFVKILDVDDNVPVFARSINSEPIVFNVKEEIPIESVIGELEAQDKDEGTNAAIIYDIINGNVDNVFDIYTNESTNIGYIKNKKRLDREVQKSYSIVVKAFNVNKNHRLGSVKFQPYKPSDFSEVQVTIKLQDINDNPPTFQQKNYVTGVKLTTNLHSNLIHFVASDPDEEGSGIRYAIRDISYVMGKKKFANYSHAFEIGIHSGMLQNTIALRPFVGGYFDLVVEARSADSNSVTDVATTNAQVYVLHDKDLLKFVFYKKPSEVKQIINDLRSKLEAEFKHSKSPIFTYFYDAQYYQRKDGSLDFESTSACFQVMKTTDNGNSKIMAPSDALRLLKNESCKVLSDLYASYGIVTVDNCVPLKSTYAMARIEIGIISVAIFIAVITITLACCASHMKQQLKKKMKILTLSTAPTPSLYAPCSPYGVPVNPPSFIGVTE